MSQQDESEAENAHAEAGGQSGSRVTPYYYAGNLVDLLKVFAASEQN